jgi:hypothetical protein
VWVRPVVRQAHTAGAQVGAVADRHQARSPVAKCRAPAGQHDSGRRPGSAVRHAEAVALAVCNGARHDVPVRVKMAAQEGLRIGAPRTSIQSRRSMGRLTAQPVSDNPGSERKGARISLERMLLSS